MIQYPSPLAVALSMKLLQRGLYRDIQDSSSIFIQEIQATNDNAIFFHYEIQNTLIEFTRSFFS